MKTIFYIKYAGYIIFIFYIAHSVIKLVYIIYSKTHYYHHWFETFVYKNYVPITSYTDLDDISYLELDLLNVT